MSGGEASPDEARFRGLEVKLATATRNGRRAKTLLYLGTADEAGFRGVAKIPLFGEGRDALTNEIRTIRQLSQDPEVAAFLPRVLCCYDDPAEPSLVLAYEPGMSLAARLRRGRPRPRGHAVQLRQMFGALEQASVGGNTDPPLEFRLYIDTIGQVCPQAAATLREVSRELRGTQFTTGRIHGDLVPKNVLGGKQNPIKILDWEYSRPYGYPVVDALDMSLRLAAGHTPHATFQLMAAAWNQPNKLAETTRWLERIWSGGGAEVRQAGPRAVSLLYVTWCAYRFALAAWTHPILQCTEVLDRLLRLQDLEPADLR